MGRSGGDIVSAMNYQVKAEVVRNYLRERRVLEEEINEYEETVVDYFRIEAEAQELRDDLACLLVSPENYREFYRLLGFDRTPLTHLGRGEAVGRGPACPLGLTPKGFTKKNKYVNLVLAAYDRLAQKAGECGAAAEKVFALVVEINEDIRRFYLNFDLMSIIHFLKNLDLDQISKKQILGSNFTPEEMGSIEERLVIRKLRPREDGVRSWPEMPDRGRAEKLTIDFLRDIFKRERESLLPALDGGKNPDPRRSA